MKTVQFTRYTVPIEIRFTEGKECCEWCNRRFMNKQGHIQCMFTGEEMVSPKDSIGWECPLRQTKEKEGFYVSGIESK